MQAIIGGKAAGLYSVMPGKIVAQVAADANTGLVDVVVRRASGNSAGEGDRDCIAARGADGEQRGVRRALGDGDDIDDYDVRGWIGAGG